MAHKTFGRKQDDQAEIADPITFDLAYEENILCRKKVNGKLLLELVGKVDSGNVKQQSEGIIQVFDVTVMTRDGDNPDQYTGKRPEMHSTYELQQVEEENVDIRARNVDAENAEDREDEIIVGVDPTSSLGRLHRVMDDPDTELDVNELAELVGWIVEQFTARPTKKSSSSSAGQGTTNHTSRRARRSQARATEKELQRTASTSSSDSSSSSD